MIALLNWRVWVLVALLALGPIGYMKGRGDGRKLERLAVAAARAQADDEARALERRRQDRADEAGRLAATREAGIRADAARARDALSGLSNAVDVAEQSAKESSAAADKARAALGVVVKQCGRRLGEVAEAADRAESEALELRQAWPK